ncbi:MAG: ORF6N domain-containing protein [Chitinispirillaceae bacterium]|nr:ORF6N domain-containing protein [Chitinispirillaceae bacterium]
MAHIILPSEIKNIIYHIRGKAVMLDSDLAGLYQVPTGRLNEAVRRNIRRFPEDFMFQLTQDEFKNLMSQFAISSSHGGRRKLPLAFSEQGVAMLSGVLNSEIAIEVNINIMRAFVQVRRLGMTILDIRRTIDGMERKYDYNFKIVFDAIRQLLEPSAPVKKAKVRIGFGPPERK